MIDASMSIVPAAAALDGLSFALSCSAPASTCRDCVSRSWKNKEPASKREAYGHRNGDDERRRADNHVDVALLQDARQHARGPVRPPDQDRNLLPVETLLLEDQRQDPEAQKQLMMLNSINFDFGDEV